MRAINEISFVSHRENECQADLCEVDSGTLESYDSCKVARVYRMEVATSTEPALNLDPKMLEK